MIRGFMRYEFMLGTNMLGRQCTHPLSRNGVEATEENTIREPNETPTRPLLDTELRQRL